MNYTSAPVHTHTHTHTHTHYTSLLVWSLMYWAQSTIRMYGIGIPYFQDDSSSLEACVTVCISLTPVLLKTSNVTTLFFTSRFVDLMTSSETSRCISDVLRTQLGSTCLPRLFPISATHSVARVQSAFSFSYHPILWLVPFKLNFKIKGRWSHMAGLSGCEIGTPYLLWKTDYKIQ
jgi:hypothetical protein